jgi:hypothetical protein
MYCSSGSPGRTSLFGIRRSSSRRSKQAYLLFWIRINWIGSFDPNDCPDFRYTNSENNVAHLLLSLSQSRVPLIPNQNTRRVAATALCQQPPRSTTTLPGSVRRRLRKIHIRLLRGGDIWQVATPIRSLGNRLRRRSCRLRVQCIRERRINSSARSRPCQHRRMRNRGFSSQEALPGR